MGNVPQAEESSPEITLLLVDDDAELCALMTEYFSMKGFAIDCVHNGRDGLARPLCTQSMAKPFMLKYSVMRAQSSASSSTRRSVISGLDSSACGTFPIQPVSRAFH